MSDLKHAHFFLHAQMQGPQAVEWEETKMRSHSPQLSVVHL